MRVYHEPQIRSGNVKEAEPMDNCGIDQAQQIAGSRNDKTRSTAGFKLCGELTTLNTIQYFLRTRE
ncbi:hypothetical protein MC04F14_16990 [Escherichia coli]|nr:hypothetical protein BK382_26290 [Escherichia coli]OJR42261.1 hypothetical protein BK381_25055 [Escherichia coli]